MAELKNYHTIRYGQADGEIKFGHLTSDNVLSSVMLRSGRDSSHYITLDSSGNKHRKGATICRGPGSFEVRAGDNVEKDEFGVYVEAISGDLILRAPSGRVIIEGVNIDINAGGHDGKTGSITMSANEKIIGDAQFIHMNGKVETKIFSEKTCQIIGNGILNCYGGMFECIDGATKLNGCKGIPSNFENQRRLA
jgi:hypothetical protein